MSIEKREATAVKIALLLKLRRNYQLKSNDSYAKDSYKVPTTAASAATTGTTSDETGKKKGKTVTLTADDMQKRKNDVKARTTLLMSLPDEHQLRFSKYKTAQELWAAILKTFGGNEATKKTKKNLLKQQYGNFKAEGSESLEQTFNRLQVYESEVQKKSETNSHNMAFISSEKHSRGNEEVNTASVSTASTNVPTDINQIDKDDMEEMDIKWNMALLSMRADRAPRSQERGRRDNFRQGSKVEEQAPKGLMAIDEDMSWTGLLKFKDDIVTDYSRPAPTVESSPDDAQNINPSVIETEASPSTISPKSFIKPAPTVESSPDDAQNINPSVIETEASPNKAETAKKPSIKYAEQYRKPTKKPNHRGNQRN
nr:ribonuclease H-like domain-containing protein [Tanacetum cinerariifolium]